MVEDGDAYFSGAGESTENRPVLERQRSKIKVPLKLDLAEGDLGDILGGWDPSRQVGDVETDGLFPRIAGLRHGVRHAASFFCLAH
jgi:hypothetical protein